MKITVQKQIKQFILILGIIVFALLLLTLVNSPTHALINGTLDKGSCIYETDLEGKYSMKVGGLGMIDKINVSNVYNGTFSVDSINGPVRNVYLYWTIRKPTDDKTIQVTVNGGVTRDISANQVFGPAKLSTPKYTYWGYIADLGTTDIKNLGINEIRIRKATGGVDMELFGVGAIIIHEDPSLPIDSHLEIKCGFDGTFVNNPGSDPSVSKWGEWSNVVCHEFLGDTNSPRRVDYFAFMSGTKELATAYRPNAFWYVTGTDNVRELAVINSLNKPAGVPNLGLPSITDATIKSNIKEYRDLFNATSEDEWDTINSTHLTPDVQIPKDHTYICFQTQSRNVPPGTQANGLGSSMQWSMSALNFAYSSSLSTPTPGFSPTPTQTPLPSPTPTPTPLSFYPWVNTIGGNVYSQTFDQTPLNSIDKIKNSFFDNGDPTNFIERLRYLSTNLYLQPVGYAIPSRSSEKDSELSDYADANSEYKTGVSWFQYFDQYLRNSIPTIIKTQITDPTITHNRMSEIHPTGNLNDVVVYLSGDLTIDVNICDTKSIFLVTGNLNIQPNLVSEGFENGCMFIVQGTTTILPGDGLGSADPDKTVYDQVHGYFVTGLFSTVADPSGDGLYLKGGVVETDTAAGNMSLNRNLGNIRSQYSPSEIIEYDPRYLYIYGDLMTYVFGYNIREGQFIRAQ